MEEETKALEVIVNGDTLKNYLKTLLVTLWQEAEGFSGKRPFGNSDWQYDVYAPLIKAGFLEGSLDSDGYVEELDHAKADEFILKLIEKCFI